MTYLEYINAHKEEIGKPKYFILADVYRDKMEALHNLANANEDFKKIYEQIPKDKKLYRKDVREAYGKNNENPYKGFIYTILWGGLGLMQWSHLTSAVSLSKEKIEEKLNRVNDYLSNNDIRPAYMSLASNGENKIPGIDVSYFTKILYFMYKGNNAIRPLIYDKWGKHMHAAISIDKNEDISRLRYVSIVGNDLKLRDYTPYDIYNDYITKMRRVSQNLGKESDDLEEFLFGYPLDKKEYKNDNNPRYFVKNYLISWLTQKLNSCNTQNQRSETPNLEIMTENKIRGREVTFGFKLKTNEGLLYLFIGELKKNTYCEILTDEKDKNIQDNPFAKKVFVDGLISEEGALDKQFIYKKFKKGDYSSALTLLRNVLDHYQHPKEVASE